MHTATNHECCLLPVTSKVETATETATTTDEGGESYAVVGVNDDTAGEYRVSITKCSTARSTKLKKSRFPPVLFPKQTVLLSGHN